jgi:hypothetical protein
MRRLALAVLVVASLGVVAVNASAMTRLSVNAKAAGYQHSHCGNDGWSCTGADLRPTNCTLTNSRAVGAQQEWECVGKIKETSIPYFRICTVSTGWSAYGVRLDGLKLCEEYRIPPTDD